MSKIENFVRATVVVTALTTGGLYHTRAEHNVSLPERPNVAREVYGPFFKEEPVSFERLITIKEKSDIRATELVIPSIGFEKNVQSGGFDNDVNRVPLVPQQGIATLEGSEEILKNKFYIYGHSRFNNRPQDFNDLQKVNIGDEILVNGVDRKTGQPVNGKKFTVSEILLADNASAGQVLNMNTDVEMVILQTSVREDGVTIANEPKEWILNEKLLYEKARKYMNGDVKDPSKYLLLLVVGFASS